MNIYAQPGTKVRFLNFNGYDSERLRAAAVFDEDKEYTVANTEVHSSSTSVYFEEVAGPWNSVMFLEVDEELPDYIKKAKGLPINEPDEGPYIPKVIVITHFESIEQEAESRDMTVEELKAMWAEDAGVDEIAEENLIDFLSGGDYCEVSIQIDGKEVVRYGDYYHDKGQEKAEGFIDALQHVYSNIELEYEYAADYNY